MASFINDFEFIINTGVKYIFRGYVYDDILTKINVLDINFLPISEAEQQSYTLTQEEARIIYGGIMSKENV
jgi:hypothetical protein